MAEVARSCHFDCLELVQEKLSRIEGAIAKARVYAVCGWDYARRTAAPRLTWGIGWFAHCSAIYYRSAGFSTGPSKPWLSCRFSVQQLWLLERLSPRSSLRKQPIGTMWINFHSRHGIAALSSEL